jgi:outer membrane protein assembly factor BamB
MVSASIVYVGIRGAVVALDRATGSEIWSADLKGADFVNVLVFEEDLYATTKGEIFCLEKSTGHIKWHNPLKGHGWGLATIAIQGAQTTFAAAGQKRLNERQAAAAAAAAS